MANEEEAGGQAKFAEKSGDYKVASIQSRLGAFLQLQTWRESEREKESFSAWLDEENHPPRL